jgi:hypothetical protein
VTADLNQARPNLPGQALPVKARRPDPLFDYIDSNFSAGFSTYNGLQAKLEKRFSTGLYLLNSFTWSKAIDNASGALEMANGDRQSVNLLSFGSSKGLSGYDQRFNNTTTVLWNLPVGHGRRFGSGMPTVVDVLVGGWALSGINTIASGQPINLMYTPGAAFVATDGSKNSAIYQADVTGDPMLPSDQRTIIHYFNTNNVHVPADVSHPFGNVGRNTAHSDSFYNLDLGIHKQLPLVGESRKLEFRTELFNALNKTNFQAATADVASSSFGVISSAFPARQVQFALKFLF